MNGSAHGQDIVAPSSVAASAAVDDSATTVSKTMKRADMTRALCHDAFAVGY